MHVLPRVRELHERFEGAISVVGVHAGKFSTERRTERIASAADRLRVNHAIVNDRQYRVWRSYGVQAWPTIALIDPEGYLLGVQAGEFDTEAIADIIERLIADADARGVLRRGPESYLAPCAPEGGVLRFPSRALERDGRLYVSDTGHGRVLEAELDPGGTHARLVRQWADLNEPQGLALGADTGTERSIFVADRAGQAIWRLGRVSDDRERVAGTGEIGFSGVQTGGPASETQLRSPWGLSFDGDRLLVSMAGSHQLHSVSLRSGVLELVAGSGAEDVRDGQGSLAALAQPTGVASDPSGTIIADCESSAVRLMDKNESVSTLVGTGLFDFGDRDGRGSHVLLQHCQDAAFAEGAVAVADTYNDRLKRIDRLTRECSAWSGEAGEAGALREPGGISAADNGTLLVADTGNHRIVRVGADGSLIEIELEDM